MDQIKEAFYRVKQDLSELSKEIMLLKLEIRKLSEETTEMIEQLKKELYNINNIKKPTKPTNGQRKETPTHPTEKPTIQHIIPAEKRLPTHIPTDNLPFQALISQNIQSSIGNEGVPTDSQSDSQTDKLEQKQEEKQQIQDEIHMMEEKIQQIQDPDTILKQLDSLKKETRFKFKRLTNQEMLVFSTIYQLEEEGKEVDYPLLSQKLNLSESSIRDYIQRLIKKNIPIIKEKLNNKKIVLHIASSLKKLASLETIIKLREL